jgi:hypothetical protein
MVNGPTANGTPLFHEMKLFVSGLPKMPDVILINRVVASPAWTGHSDGTSSSNP